MSDDDPHITIAAATDEMRRHGTHIAVHSRVSSKNADEACFLGGEDYPNNIKQDTNDLRQSYTNPLHARASLLSDDINTAPVGYTINSDGSPQWYVLNDELDPVYLKDTKFYRAGEGATEHLVFLNPISDAPCRAIFLGNERPEPHSPDPEPTNLELSMTSLSLAPTEESVTPYIDLRRVNKPLVFETNDNTGEWATIRTSWQSWYAENCEGYVVFKYDGMGKVGGRVFCTREMPVVVVYPYLVRSSSRPIQFVGPEPELDVFKTKRGKWMSGMNDCFFVYLEKAVFYLALTLPDDSGR